MSQSRASSPTGWISFYQFELPEALIAPFKKKKMFDFPILECLNGCCSEVNHFFFFRGENEILLVNGKYQQWSEAPEQSAKHVPHFKTKPPQAEEGEKNQWADQNVLSMSLYRGVFLTHDGLIDWENVLFFSVELFPHMILHYLTSGSAPCYSAGKIKKLKREKLSLYSSHAWLELNVIVRQFPQVIF